jgi:hypothetical protein
VLRRCLRAICLAAAGTLLGVLTPAIATAPCEAAEVGDDRFDTRAIGVAPETMIGGEARAADEASVGAWIGGLAALVDASGAQATGIIRIAVATGGEPGDSEHLGKACESDARGGSEPKRHMLRIADPEGTAAAGRSLARQTPSAPEFPTIARMLAPVDQHTV